MSKAWVSYNQSFKNDEILPIVIHEKVFRTKTFYSGFSQMNSRPKIHSHLFIGYPGV